MRLTIKKKKQTPINRMLITNHKYKTQQHMNKNNKSPPIMSQDHHNKQHKLMIIVSTKATNLDTALTYHK